MLEFFLLNDLDLQAILCKLALIRIDDRRHQEGLALILFIRHKDRMIRDLCRIRIQMQPEAVPCPHLSALFLFDLPEKPDIIDPAVQVIDRPDAGRTDQGRQRRPPSGFSRPGDEP